MRTARLFAGMATQDIADLEHTTQLRIAGEPRSSAQGSKRVIGYLKVKATQLTTPAMPAKWIYPNKRLRGPLRTWAI
jgi:hypothetical protein